MFRLDMNDDEVLARGFDYADATAKQAILEDSGAGDASLDDFVERQRRQQAMTAMLTWVNEGDYSPDALDALIVGSADLDGNDEISDDEDAYYQELWTDVAQAMLSFGAEASDIEAFVNDDDEEAGKRIGQLIASKLEEMTASDVDIISGYVDQGEDLVLESTIRAVRDGKVLRIKKKFKKIRLTSAQKMALKKARAKAFTAMAKRHRMKSMKIRKQRGL